MVSKFFHPPEHVASPRQVLRHDVESFALGMEPHHIVPERAKPFPAVDRPFTLSTGMVVRGGVEVVVRSAVLSFFSFFREISRSQVFIRYSVTRLIFQ
jgi:hypothetical protein